LPTELADGLTTYYELLALWNRKINLTALDDPDEAIDRLLLEPLAAAKHVAHQAPAVLDIGSGGGSPALPLKLVVPTMVLTMVESKVRKAAFLREAVRLLRLPDARVETARYEELLSRPHLHEAADIITMRAVRTDARALRSLEALLKPGGRFLLFRSVGGEDVPGTLPPTLVLMATVPLVETTRSRLVLIEKRRVAGA
jgi:16S rRNA (guanine527-N7)-methyltransferase